MDVTNSDLVKYRILGELKNNCCNRNRILPSLVSICLQKISYQTTKLCSNVISYNTSLSDVSVKGKGPQFLQKSELENYVYNEFDKSNHVNDKPVVGRKDETDFVMEDIIIPDVIIPRNSEKYINIINIKNEIDDMSDDSYKLAIQNKAETSFVLEDNMTVSTVDSDKLINVLHIKKEIDDIDGKVDESDIVISDTMIFSDNGEQINSVAIKTEIGEDIDVSDNYISEKKNEIDFAMEDDMILSYNIVNTINQIDDVSRLSTSKKGDRTEFIVKNAINSSGSSMHINSMGITNGHFQEHVDAVRDVVKIYRCNKCDYKAAQSGNLKTHISAVHEVNKPYKCQQCAYSASQACHLRRHMLAVHEKEESKLIKCFKCGYSTYELGNLRMHINGVHEKNTSHKCPECDYRTAFSSNLRRHINNVHKEIKPFKCDKCDYRASEERAVRMHINAAHEAIKPFQCPKCDFKTSWPSNLRKHKKKVHGGKEGN